MPLTIVQADQSLEHLSNVELLTANSVLFTGGNYVSDGNITLTLPSDGTTFAITVQTGVVTFSGGTVNGVSDATLPVGGRRVFAKQGTDWKLISSSAISTNFKTVSSSTSFSLTDPWLWVITTGGDVIISIPVGLPDDTTFAVVRDGSGSVTVDPGGSEGVVDPATGIADTSGALINREKCVVWFKKHSGHWRFATAP